MSTNETVNSRQEDPRVTRRMFLTATGKGTLAAAAAALLPAGMAYPEGTNKTIRMAVVGGGFGASFHWHEHPNCRVTAVTDLYPARRQILRERFQCGAVYDSLEIMLKEAQDVDAVAIFSGAPDHAKHARMCLERGWHVVTAVPACLTLEDARMLKAVKEKTGLKYMMAESSWYRQENIYARNLFRAGGFGELFYTETEYYHDGGDPDKETANIGSLVYNPDGSRSWRWGFPPMLYPTHCTGFLTGVTGERVVKVSCLGWRSNQPKLREHPLRTENVYKNPFWNQTALMLTDQDHASRCNVFWRCMAGGERAQWFGDQATLYMVNGGVHGDLQNVRDKGLQPAQVPQYWKDSPMLPPPMRHDAGHGGSAIFISAEFINALLEDREPEIDLYESLAMTVPGIVAHQSAFQNGEQLAVPQFDRKQA
jgi:predicted dehydrogenase